MTAEEFRKYYDSLSDEGLLEIDRADLTDIARASYDEELASRGLVIESAPQPQAEPLTGDIPWVPLDTFNAEEIKLIRALLEAEEIPTSMEAQAAENYPPATAGSVLFVPEPFLDRAREILATQISEEELIAEAESYQPPEDA